MHEHRGLKSLQNLIFHDWRNNIEKIIKTPLLLHDVLASKAKEQQQRRIERFNKKRLIPFWFLSGMIVGILAILLITH
jgi:hypothetical protein